MFYEAKVNYFFYLGDNFYKEFIEHKKKTTTTNYS